MVSKLAIGVIVVIVVVGAGIAAYVLTRPPAEKYELSYGYQVGEYYNYKVTTIGAPTSTYSMQVTAVKDNEFTVKYTATENIGPPYLATAENVDVTLAITTSKRGEMVSWEIENVVPAEYRENVEAYENSMMGYWQLFGGVLPKEPVSIGQKWEKPIDVRIPWGPAYMPVTGEVNVHFVGAESVTVEAGTFDCWRLDYSTSASGELTGAYTATMNITLQGTAWYSKQNCVDIKSTTSMTMSYAYDNYSSEHSSQTTTELVERGTV